MITGKIINKEEALCVRDWYKQNRYRFLYLKEDYQNTVEASLVKKNIVPYDKIESLLKYIEQRDYVHRGPLQGYDLKMNGFTEILDGFEMPFKRYPIDSILTFTDVEIIDSLKLINKLIQLETYSVLLPYSAAGKTGIYFLKDSTGNECARNIQDYFQEAKALSAFVKCTEELKESNPYIDIDRLDCHKFQYFPTSYVTFEHRPYIRFQQSNCVHICSHNRSMVRYEVDEKLKLTSYIGQEKVEKSYPDMSSIFREVFSFPSDSPSKIKIITELYSKIFGVGSGQPKVYYDWVKECYCFDSETEDRIFAKYTIRKAKGLTFCKYTSLNTLMCILNSGKMRLNSLVTMNDPTETEKIHSEGCNFICKGETHDDLVKFANNYYLTSFTYPADEEDLEDLNMWRFYGDNGAGVCLLFEPLIEDHQVFEVNYTNLKSKELGLIEQFLHELKEHEVRFCFQSYVDRYLFIKPKEFKSEREIRLIIGTIDEPQYTVYSNNNIVTPYIERELTYKSEMADKKCKKTFPLKLSGIILGPEMKNKEINKLNLESMIQAKSLFRGKVKVRISSLNCYRQ